MRVVVFAADHHRCGHRLIWPARALAGQGAEVEVITRADDDEAKASRPWDRWEHVDVVVIQRPLHRRLLESVSRFQADGVSVVVDIDDDFTVLPQGNVVWPSVQPALSPDSNWQILAEACRWADLVTVTTPALARRYGGHGRVAIIPNHIPASYLRVEAEPHDGVRVGWTGMIYTHPDDLQVTRGGVGRALVDTGAGFHVVGRPDGVRQALALVEEPTSTGMVPLERYPVEMAAIDIGIVPLEGTKFNEAKSTLKGLEFAALGVPFVASPTGPYEALPVGTLARKPREWERSVRALVNDEGLRVATAGRGREWATTQTVEANCGQWMDAWGLARSRARRRVPA